MAGGPGGLFPGSHGHRAAGSLPEQLALAGKPLELEQRAEPAGDAVARISSWLGEAELEIAYPGIWLRDDVYATHGHYMDCHMRLPKLECIAAPAAMRALRLPERPEPADYERVLRPVYGLTFGLAQGGVAGRATRPSERIWRAISSRNGKGSRARRAALRAAVPASVWSINRLLRADFNADFSTGSISQSGIAAATELVQRLGIQAAHTITGHTHRAGPAESDAERVLPAGRLHNTGSWIFASAFHHPRTPPGPSFTGTVTGLTNSELTET